MAAFHDEQITSATASDGPSLDSRSLSLTYKLDNVDGSSAAEVLRNALDDSRIPRPGEAARDFDNYVVASRTARLIGRRQVQVEVEWRPNTIAAGTPGGSGTPGVDVDAQEPSETATPRGSFGVSLVGIQTNFDQFGLVVVPYNGDSQVATIEANVPVAVRRFERLEPFSPEAKARLYINKINATEWLGAAPRTYLCRAITGEPVALESGAVAWRVTYEFESSAEPTWDVQVVYIDKETGNPPEDVSPGNGIVMASPFAAADFNLLNLSYI